MLDQYLNSTQTVDKRVATANQQYYAEAQSQGGDEKKDSSDDAVIEHLDKFMRRNTDKKTLRQGRKDAKRMGSKT